MASYTSSSRHHYGENGNKLSINTDRVRPHDVLAVRGSPSPDHQFDPTAPTFINSQGSSHNHSATPGINMPSQAYSPGAYTQNTAHSYNTTFGMNMLSHGYSPADHAQNGVDHRHIRGAQDQNVAVYEQEHMSYGQNLTHFSGPMHLPRPSLLPNPTQSPPLFARPRSALIQHSPPHRAYHEPITASQVSECAQATIRPSRAVLLRRLKDLHEEKKQSLKSFEGATKRVATLSRTLDSLQLAGNDRLQELYQSEFEFLNTDREKDALGRKFKRLEVEIDELEGDLAVPHEARAEDECLAVAGE